MKHLKNLILISTIGLLACCNAPQENPRGTTIDTEAELAKIEAFRADFQQTIKEKRYGDLKYYRTKDLISIGPGSAAWEAYRRLREESKGKFRYDSILMYPKETVILNDTMAYDFGVSSMYYADSSGNTIELKDSFMVLLKKDKEGNWRLFREIASAQVN